MKLRNHVSSIRSNNFIIWAKSALAGIFFLSGVAGAGTSGMTCASVLTCVNGLIYPSACGPKNGDRPMGFCKPKPLKVNFIHKFGPDSKVPIVIDQSDFSPATRGGLSYQIENLPDGLRGSGLHIFAINRSDDQWVFVSTKIGTEHGTKPNQEYTASFTISMVSKTPGGCFGVGGSPHSVYIKGGVVNTEPIVIYDEKRKYYKFSINKGNQVNVGPDAIGLGDIGVSLDCNKNTPWTPITRSGKMDVTADEYGNIWAYVGTDSGFEAASDYYYDHLVISLQPK